jgi:hypothetical protein
LIQICHASGTWSIDGYHEWISSFWRDGQSRPIGVLRFTGEGGDSGNGSLATSYGIYQQGGAWTYPYPDLCIGFHTGIKIGANSGYNGTRFYNDSNWATEIFSVGNGDNHVRVLNNLYVTGTVTGSNLSGTNTGDQDLSGYLTTSGTAADADKLDGYDWMQSGKNVRASEFYADGWLRNYNADTGLYNQSSGNHFYSKTGGIWAITGAGSGVELQFRSNHESTIRGYVYGDTNSNFGLLNNVGGWSVRCYAGGGYGGALTGTWTASGDIIAFSDARVKENVETIDNALDKVLALRGVTYNRTDLKDTSKKIGVIAQEVQKILPEVVQEQEDGMLGVSYGNIVGVLIEAIKEQQKQIDELKALLK